MFPAVAMTPLIASVLLLALSPAVRADRLDVLTEQVARHGERRVEIELSLGAGQVFVFRGLRDLVADVRVMYDGDEHTVSVAYEEVAPQVGRLTLISNQRKNALIRHLGLQRAEGNIWRVELNPEIVYTFQAHLGLAQGEFDLTDLRVDGFELDVGAGDLTVLFNARNQGRIPEMRISAGAAKLALRGLSNASFDALDLGCGAGQFTLDFSGDLRHSARVELSIGLGTATVRIPEYVGARIDASDGILSSVSAKGDFSEVRKGVFANDRYGQLDARLDVDIDAAFGSVKIEEISQQD